MRKKSASICVYLWLIVFSFFLLSCSELEKPKTEPFFADAPPPAKKEFRWSNGKMPKSFDPALASAPPETDIVRAVFDGLTDTDSKNLQAVPAVAEKWESSGDFRTWTFYLRKEAKWSNGETVKAEDFVRSWKRLAEMGDKVPHYRFLTNIVGIRKPETENKNPASENREIDSVSRKAASQNLPFTKTQPNGNSSANPAANSRIIEEKKTESKKDEPKFGVEAVDGFALKVSLIKPDKQFPALVANPIFRPIYGDGKNLEGENLNADIVTNGAFRIFSIGQDGITLDRSEHYWNRDAVELERVRFVPQESAEKALEAYRAGELDAVTNADFEPLALKLLTPFDDFERTTHSAINFYEFNLQKPPFNDPYVREALAISIEREQLTQDEMEGATEPAFSFLPFDEETEPKLTQDKEKGKKLLAAAGFPDGQNFPPIQLVVNRNNIQQKIANSVAKMWKENLNVKTDIIVKESDEIAELKKTNNFDMIRRNAVLPTTDETANMLAIFPPKKEVKEKDLEKKPTADEKNNSEKKLKPETSPSGQNSLLEIPTFNTLVREDTDKTVLVEHLDENSLAILTEYQAISELPAIPLYFPTSYSLVKPYILGFEMNSLDAPSLKTVRIDVNWQPKKANGES
ncbi:MAG: peptide ABC transporter substrate-binding protein [Pyrinomonadaceae bacterium]